MSREEIPLGAEETPGCDDVIHILEEDMKGDLETHVHRAERRHYAVLSNGFVALLLMLALEVVLGEILFNYLSQSYYNRVPSSPLLRLALGYVWEGLISDRWTDVISVVLRVGPFWLLTLGIVVPLYYFRVRVPLWKARQELADYEEKQRRERLSTLEGRLRYLQEEVRRLSHVAARVFLDNLERYKEAKEWREKAEDILDYALEHGPEKANMGEAQSLVSSINELILREEGELRAQRNWRYANMVIIVGYIVALVAIVVANARRTDAPIPVFGIPPSILMWGAAGSLAAILRKFYTEEKRVRFEVEFRWLLARPVIGIIMGAVVYLAMKTGLFLLGAAPSSGTEPVAPAGRLEVYWIIAFLAGFSDKFYLSIINLLVERTTGDKKEAEGVVGKGEGQKDETTQGSPAASPTDHEGSKEEP